VSELAELLRPGPPSFHLTSADTTDLGDATVALIRARPTAAVRRIRGSRSRSTDGLFDELAAALQFPAYFGANWNALSDMLSDLRWLPAKEYLLVVEDADELLADAPDGVVNDCLRVLAAAAEIAAPIPFQIVLQAVAGGRIARALNDNGTPFDVVALTAPVRA
jgi:RNAse (barnase) inhibitor barstar